MRRDLELSHILLNEPLEALLGEAARQRDQGHGRMVSYSRKVFVPLTRLCRNVCHYCTFAKVPEESAGLFLAPEEVLEIARAGERAGCREALFTLGDKPELRYPSAREQLRRFGYPTTVAYLASVCERVIRETSLLPHVNPGVLARAEIAMLRKVSVSQGIMLESSAERLCRRGHAHYGSPDKRPAVRLQTLRDAGELVVPFTSGILIGIGETRVERIASLIALRDLHAEYGHLQEVIIQNFRAKPDTKMRHAAEPDLDDLRWTIAAARIIFGAEMNIQAPPNLTPDAYPLLLEAGINDWGGISPVTPDHVNPEAPWPAIESLRQHVEATGKLLVERLAVYPAYARDSGRWQDPELAQRVVRSVDSSGYARPDAWSPGLDIDPSLRGPSPASYGGVSPVSQGVAQAIARARDGVELGEAEIVALFEARDGDFEAVCAAADEMRREVSGDLVRYVVNRNLNYTNVCSFHCKFCAFSKARNSSSLRGPAYDLSLEEVARRVREAWERGATEVCMQGGIHPDYTGDTYLELLHTAKTAVPGMHVHAFSPLEVAHGATTLGISVDGFLSRLRDAGLGSLPGTAAEVLDDEVRAVLCPDKLDTAHWLDVIEAAHNAGLPTTATIMFGHIERPQHWARHLLAIRRVQARTGGFTEFVPLPFVHMEAPLYFKGLARKGPTFREAVLMHAVARLALHPVLTNIQTSWVKMGPKGAATCLASGANDLGGTLMNESISRSAGTRHGQELPPAKMEELIGAAGRQPQQRTTLYGLVAEGRRRASFAAQALTPVVLTPASRRARAKLEPAH